MAKKLLNLKGKLLLLYFVFTGIPLGIICFFSFQIYSRDAADIENVFFDYATSQISATFSEQITEYKNILAQIITSPSVTDFFKHSGRFGFMPPESALMRNQMYQELSNYVRMNSYIASAAYVDRNAEMVLYQRMGSNMFMSAKMENKTFREALLKYSSEEYFSDVNIMQAATLPGAPEDTKQYLYFTYPAVDLITRDIYGVIILEVDNSVFSTIMKPGGSGILDQYIIVNSSVIAEDGTIVFSPGAGNIGEKFKGVLNKNSLIQKESRIRGTSLDLVLLFEGGSLMRYVNNFRNIVIASYLVIMVIFVFIIVLVINRIMRGSQKITQAIGEFRKTRRQSAIEINKDNEILFAIADQFNIMSMEIEKYIEELKETNVKISQIKDQQHHAEIQALQAQINPHFIYNMLDSINWIAIDNEQDKISSMLSGLGSLLRYSISNIDTLVPLRSELEWMQKYVYIQSERFGQSIVLTQSIEGGAPDFPIYKMLLQPLVENSIVHGFDREQKYPKIKIIARIAANGSLEIQLSDNGRGMLKETLKKIKEICRNPGADNSDSVGVSNVVNRLWHYYGPDSKISVENRPNRGVSFHLLIPRKDNPA